MLYFIFFVLNHFMRVVQIDPDNKCVSCDVKDDIISKCVHHASSNGIQNCKLRMLVNGTGPENLLARYLISMLIFFYALSQTGEGACGTTYIYLDGSHDERVLGRNSKVCKNLKKFTDQLKTFGLQKLKLGDNIEQLFKNNRKSTMYIDCVRKKFTKKNICKFVHRSLIFFPLSLLHSDLIFQNVNHEIDWPKRGINNIFFILFVKTKKKLKIQEDTSRGSFYATISSTGPTGHLHFSQWQPRWSISSHSEHGVAHSLHTDRLHTLHVLRILKSSLHSLQIEFVQRSHLTRSKVQINWSQVVHWFSSKQSQQIVSSQRGHSSEQGSHASSSQQGQIFKSTLTCSHFEHIVWTFRT